MNVITKKVELLTTEECFINSSTKQFHTNEAWTSTKNNHIKVEFNFFHWGWMSPLHPGCFSEFSSLSGGDPRCTSEWYSKVFVQTHYQNKHENLKANITSPLHANHSSSSLILTHNATNQGPRRTSNHTPSTCSTSGPGHLFQYT